MKKFFLMLVVALPFLMVSCGDDEASLTLDKTVLSLDYSQTAELTASEKNGVWASSNEFVASVDQKGKVTANHEGKATITVSKNGESASCVVTVNATNNYFCTITTWGITPNQLTSTLQSANALPVEIDEEPLLDQTTTNEETGVTTYSVMYTAKGGGFPWYGFVFTNNSLSGSTVTFDDTIEENNNLKGFLNQRYQELENYKDEYGVGMMYLDNVSYTLANMSALVSITESEDWEILYRPVSHTKAEIIDATVADAAKALRMAAKNK